MSIWRNYEMREENKGYMLAAVLGMIGGGIAVVLATKAVPRMMAGMMRKMMSRMGEDGCDPAQI